MNEELPPDIPNEELPENWYLDSSYQLSYEAQKQECYTMRKMNYPSLTDQLDAFWKGGDEAEAMRQQVSEVKSRFPKPI
jgi:hypothetical protein